MGSSVVLAWDSHFHLQQDHYRPNRSNLIQLLELQAGPTGAIHTLTTLPLPSSFCRRYISEGWPNIGTAKKLFYLIELLTGSGTHYLLNVLICAFNHF